MAVINQRFDEVRNSGDMLPTATMTSSSELFSATIIFGGLFIPGVFSDHYNILAHILSYNLANIGLRRQTVAIGASN